MRVVLPNGMTITDPIIAPSYVFVTSALPGSPHDDLATQLVRDNTDALANSPAVVFATAFAYHQRPARFFTANAGGYELKHPKSGNDHHNPSTERAALDTVPVHVSAEDLVKHMEDSDVRIALRSLVTIVERGLDVADILSSRIGRGNVYQSAGWLMTIALGAIGAQAVPAIPILENRAKVINHGPFKGAIARAIQRIRADATDSGLMPRDLYLGIEIVRFLKDSIKNNDEVTRMLLYVFQSTQYSAAVIEALRYENLYLSLKGFFRKGVNVFHEQAARALAAVGGETAISELIALTDSDVSSLREVAISSLVAVGETAVPLMMEVLRSEGHPRRKDAMEDAIMRMGEGAVIPMLAVIRNPK